MNNDDDDIEDYDVDDYEQGDIDNDYSEELQNISDDLKKLRDYSNNVKEGKVNSASSKAGKQAAEQGSKGAGGQAAKQGAKEAGGQAAKQGAKEAGGQVAKEGAKEAGKQAAKEAGKQAGKQGAKAALKAGAQVAATGGKAAAGIATGPAGWVLLGIDVVLNLGKLLKKRIQQKKNEPTDRKVKRWIREHFLLVLLLALILLPVMLIMLLFSAGVTVTTHDSVERVDEFVTCMQGDGECKEITGLKMPEITEGLDKPLVLFTDKEYEQLATTYLRFSHKYFETGEGLEFENQDQIVEDFNIEGGSTGMFAESEIDSAMLAVFFSLQARVFSKVTWIVESLDPEKPESRVLNKPEDFDVLYDSADEDANLLDFASERFLKWLRYIDEDAEPYQIKIPEVDKYNATKEKSQCLHYYSHSTTTVGGETSDPTEITECPDPGEKITEWIPSKVYKNKADFEKYKIGVLKSYLNLLVEFLPEWFEPYSLFLATGDASYAREFYNTYLDLIQGRLADGTIVVRLHYIEIEQETAIKSKSRTTSQVDEVDEDGNKTGNKLESVTETKTETANKSTNYHYNAIPDHGMALTYLLIDSDYFYSRDVGDPAYQAENKSLQNKYYPNRRLYRIL